MSFPAAPPAMRACIISLTCFVFVVLGSGDALAGKRIALVIGNSAYQHVPTLVNPANDAEATSILLKRIGFDVVQWRTNLGIDKMRRAVSDLVIPRRVPISLYLGHPQERNARDRAPPGEEFDPDAATILTRKDRDRIEGGRIIEKAPAIA